MFYPFKLTEMAVINLLVIVAIIYTISQLGKHVINLFKMLLRQHAEGGYSWKDFILPIGFNALFTGLTILLIYNLIFNL